MSYINYAVRQICCKIVYYGPGLSGKTANLRHLHEHTVEAARGRLISLETESERTLFFDFMPIDLGAVAGYRVRLQLYTVPGQMLERTRESGHHLLTLINDILDLAKLEAGKVSLEPAPVVVADLVGAALRLVQEGAQRKGHRVATTHGAPLAPVLLDERRMKQVLVNLLANAIKFTPAGGTIGIATAEVEDGTALSFTVSDTGIGIAPEDRGRLFQPFVQLDSRLSRAHAGAHPHGSAHAGDGRPRRHPRAPRRALGAARRAHHRPHGAGHVR